MVTRPRLQLAAALALLLPAAGALADARSDYLLHCGGCHLEDGSGNPPEVPDLRRSLAGLAASAEGRSYLTRVPGASQVPISDERLAAVFNWIFTTFYPQHSDLRPFDAAEIGRTRHLPMYDPLRARAELFAGTTAAR